MNRLKNKLNNEPIMPSKFSSFSPNPIPQTFEERIEWITEQLRDNFEDYFKKENYDDYLKSFFDELDGDPEIVPFSHIAEFQEEMRGVEDNRLVAGARVKSSIKTALNFCHLALKMSREGNETRAQFYATQAAMFSGLTRGYALGVYWSDDDDALIQMAKAGARKRAEKYQPLRDFVIAEVAKRNYKSKRHAALSLKDDVLKLAIQLGIGLSEPQAEKTISGWLDGLTFAGKKSL